MRYDYFCSLGGNNDGDGGLEHVLFSAVKEQQNLDDVAKYGEGATDITGGANTNNEDGNQSFMMDKILIDAKSKSLLYSVTATMIMMIDSDDGIKT